MAKQQAPQPDAPTPDNLSPESTPSFDINSEYKDTYLRSNYESDDDFELKNLEEDLHKIVVEKIHNMPIFASLRPLESKDLTSGLEVKILNQKKGIISIIGGKIMIKSNDGKTYEVESEDDPFGDGLSEKARDVVNAMRKYSHLDPDTNTRYFWVKEVKGFTNSLYGYTDLLIKKKIIARTAINDKRKNGGKGAKFLLIEQKNSDNKIRISNIDHAVDPIMKLKKQQLRELYRICEDELFKKTNKHPDIISFNHIFTEYFKVNSKYMFNCLPEKVQGNILDELRNRGYSWSTKNKNGDSMKEGINFIFKPS